MRDNKLQKVIASILIFAQLALMPAWVFAFESTAVGSINPVPINDSGSFAGNTGFDVPFTAARTAYSGPVSCVSAIKTFELGDSAASVGLSFSAIIGGGGTLAARLLAEITAYNAFLDCALPILATLDTPPLVPPNAYTSTLKQQLITQIKADMQTYQDKLKTAQARYNVASQNIWKALLITILLNTTRVVADQLVNKLVNNYKIANLKAYTDSVATLMYDNQFIRDNFPDNQGQLMARSILENPLFRTQVPPGIFVQADTALGYTSLGTDDPNFYTNLAKAGFASTNPFYLHTAYVGGVNLSHGTALVTAQAHIAQGSGYKAPVNCAGSLAQQKQIDQASKAASDQLANRQALLDNLTQAKNLGQNVSAGDLAKAQADYNAALAAWNNIPFAVTGNNAAGNAAAGGGNNTEGSAAIVMCEAVNSPAVLVNQGIDAMFKSLNLGQYTDSNLPGFLSALSGIATQIGSSMVLGGLSGKSVNVNENLSAGLGAGVAATQAATIQSLDNNAQNNMAKGIYFSASTRSGVTNGYTLNWTVATQQISTASYVTFSGQGIPNPGAHQPLSGSLDFVSPTVGNYTMTVYSSSGQNLISVITSTVPQTQAYNYNPSGPAVAGAFTSRPVLAARGPAVTFAPRGPSN